MYDIILRFPNKELADEFCGQMSDGFGEGFCGFDCWQKKLGTTGKNAEDFERITEDGKEVYFVNEIFDV